MKFFLTLIFLSTSSVFAQRVEFNDPDLTFSFVKPESWTIKDGLTVFAIPGTENLEVPNTFFSITYFEGPTQVEQSESVEADLVFDVDEIEPNIPSDLKEFKSGEIGRIYIANETALWASYYHTQNEIRVKAVSYVFTKLNQRFEIRISAPINQFEENEPLFQSIINSLEIR